MRFRNGAALGYAPAISHQSQVSHAAPSFVNGFCMLYVHLCRSANTCAPGRRQPAGLPSTRGYAPHMRQAFFLGPAGGALFHVQKRSFATSGGLRRDMRCIYICDFAAFFGGVRRDMRCIYICDSVIFGSRGLRRDMRCIYICDSSTREHAL